MASSLRRCWSFTSLAISDIRAVTIAIPNLATLRDLLSKSTDSPDSSKMRLVCRALAMRSWYSLRCSYQRSSAPRSRTRWTGMLNLSAISTMFMKVFSSWPSSWIPSMNAVRTSNQSYLYPRSRFCCRCGVLRGFFGGFLVDFLAGVGTGGGVSSPGLLFNIAIFVPACHFDGWST